MGAPSLLVTVLAHRGSSLKGRLENSQGVGLGYQFASLERGNDSKATAYAGNTIS